MAPLFWPRLYICKCVAFACASNGKVAIRVRRVEKNCMVHTVSPKVVVDSGATEADRFLARSWPSVFSAMSALSTAPSISCCSLRYLAMFTFASSSCRKKGKGSPYSITERRVPELILVLGSQPAGDVSHKPGVRLPSLSARPTVTVAQPLRGLLPVSLLGEQRHDGCTKQFA